MPSLYGAGVGGEFRALSWSEPNTLLIVSAVIALTLPFWIAFAVAYRRRLGQPNLA
jgi:hypothetical protein